MGCDVELGTVADDVLVWEAGETPWSLLGVDDCLRFWVEALLVGIRDACPVGVAPVGEALVVIVETGQSQAWSGRGPDRTQRQHRGWGSARLHFRCLCNRC